MSPVHLDEDLPHGMSANTLQYRTASVCTEASRLLPVSRWRNVFGDLEFVDATTTIFHDYSGICSASAYQICLQRDKPTMHSMRILSSPCNVWPAMAKHSYFTEIEVVERLALETC